MKKLFLGLFIIINLFAQTHSVTLTWTAPVSGGTVTGYNVKRSLTTGGPYLVVGSAVAPVATYTDTTNLIEGTKYYYVVSSTGPGGESVNSSEANGTIPFSAPNTPTNITVVVH